MTFFLIILTITASSILIGVLFKKKESGCTFQIVAAIISCIASVNGTSTGCRDGWNSFSIGSQGACSWHGGVVTQLNNFGEILTTISILVIALKIIHWLKTS